jgi:hypothetical protein
VTGLVLLDAHPTQTRVTRLLPGRCHDALHRLLRTTPWSTRKLLAPLVAWIRRTGAAGYRCLDDVVVEKASAKRLPWAGWTYSFANKRKVSGMHVVVLLWCSTDRRWRIPVAVRLWRPKRSCAPVAYQTRLQLAAGMLTEVVASRLPFQYLVMDTHYTAGWFTRLAGRLGIDWVGTLPPRTTVTWRGRRQPVAELAGRLRLSWRPKLGLRAAAVSIYAPTYGMLRLVVTKTVTATASAWPPTSSPSIYRRWCAQAQQVERGDDLPRHQAVRRAGRLPVLERSGDGPPRRPRPAGIRRAATPARPPCRTGRDRQGTLAAGHHPPRGTTPVPLKACPAHLRATA